MSRLDRRKKEREQLKMEKWVNNLSPHQAECINKVVADRVVEELNTYMHQFSICNSSKLFMEFDTTLDQNEKYINELDHEIVEFAKWGRKFGKGWLEKLKEIDGKAKDLIKKMLSEGAKQKDIISAIKKEFDVPTAAANRGFKVAKEEWLMEKDENALEYIFQEPGIKEVEEMKEVKEILEVVDNNGFEIVSRTEVVKMELKGKHNNFIYESDNGDIKVTVENENLTFTSIDEVDKYMFDEIEKFKDQMREIKEVFNI